MRIFVAGLVAITASVLAPVAARVGSRAVSVHAAPASPHTVSVSARDSIDTQLLKDAYTFFAVWTKWWRHSQTNNWFTADGRKLDAPFKQGAMRVVFQHCHTRATVFNEGVPPLAGDYEAVLSATSAFSICPSWSLGGATRFVNGLSADESDDADAAINTSVLPQVRAARATLLASYARAQKVLPNNANIVGQRVRFLLDQGLADSAMIVATECQAEGWWCQLFRGYVHSRQHHLDVASFAFDSALFSMPPNEQCAWLDIAALLPKIRSEQFAAQTCEERRAQSDRLWWLADPMFSQAGNERRAEHIARNVRLVLLSSLPTDGRFQYWDRNTPADALRRLVLRYGWPGYLGWGGVPVDDSHDRWIKGFNNVPQPPYTTYEYLPGRLHSTPSWTVLENPFSASDSSWDLYGNAPADHPERWWPEEHMVRARKLVTIPEGQIAMMRREHEVLLATANDMDALPLRDLADGSVATFMLTSHPDSLQVLGQQPIARSSTLRQRAHIASAPTLFAIEASDTRPGGVDARTRRGVAPPIRLSAMRAGEIAISDPAILQIASADSALRAPDDLLLNRMLGRTNISISALPTIGVYWESYGIRETDTVTVSVRIERRESVSTFRRIGMALNVANDPNSSVKIAWREPDRTHITRTINGAVPIQVRTVMLNISNLSPGPYVLVTEIASGARPVMTSSRRISEVQNAKRSASLETDRFVTCERSTSYRFGEYFFVCGNPSVIHLGAGWSIR